MNKKTFDHVRLLTSTDKKNLTEKTLKAVEEIGELAKVVLPYQNAFATNHRFIDKSKILEECADVLLCVLSIAYDMDFTDDDIDAAVNHKMKYWADLQAREGKVTGPIPYEIHITVDMESEKLDIEHFRQSCKALSVKPILLDLHLNGEKPIKDLMTSSTHMGNNREAFEEMKRIATGLKGFGYNVLREKIETIPWHPAAPSLKHENPLMPPNCYFESHLNCLCSEEKLDSLRQIAQNHDAKMSTNAFKRFDDGTFTIMVTKRTYDGVYESFNESLESLKKEILANDFELEKEIVEFSIFDTRISHDAKWLTSK